ncbi:YciI family protein [Streptomyces sp. NPDC052682]|uniref:YciI family protein n=1 Tax=Streptomyces sp. NPDC052682 TaxID=3154954 RepID=UPI00341AE316
MPFYIHGHDRPGVESALLELAEEHWSYMDRFADRLVLRGPTLSDDGEHHTGSVHVVDLPDRASAERFAHEEPYWKAGLYEHVTTVRAIVLLDRRPSGEPLTLTTGHWPATPRVTDTTHLLGSGLGFAAALVDDDRSHTTGILAVVAALPDEARKIVQPLADHLAGGAVPLTARRWCRGGRS